MFDKSARFYDAIYSWKDYKGESARLHALIQERNPQAKTLLDVACGTGLHLGYLKQHYRTEGLDADSEMLEIARERNPEVPLHHGDMIRFDLDESFDVITCLFSSIGYVETTDRLNEAVANMARHLAPKGLLVVEPWILPEKWEPGRVHALYVDEDDLKIARINNSRVSGNVSLLEMHYLVGTPEEVAYFTEMHRMGLFTHDEYVTAFTDAGLIVDFEQEGLMGRGLYIGLLRS
jgi:ubiquinone/menaquinone biosynthesis C-methylase UbiE